jgi:lichenan operon transcriptional antiterminator
VRTIEKDLNSITSELPPHALVLNTQKGKGVKLFIKNIELTDAFFEKIADKLRTNNFFDNQTSRVKFIISLLIDASNYIKSDQIAEQLYISRSQLSKDMKHVTTRLHHYDLYIESKPHLGIRLAGLEQNKRLCIVKESYKHSTLLKNKSSDSQDFANIIEEITTSVLIQRHYTLSDVGLQNLILHLIVSINRIKMGCALVTPIPPSGNALTDELSIATEILNVCASKFDFVPTQGERQYLATNLHGKHEFTNHDFISEKINRIVFTGLHAVKDSFEFDFTMNLGLRMALALHVAPLITRLTSHMQFQNVMTEDIKQRYPLAFDIASVFLKQSLSAELYSRVSDDEKSFVALHFASCVLDEPNTSNNEILLISDKKQSENILLQKQLVMAFPAVARINIVNSYEVTSHQINNASAICTSETKIHQKFMSSILVNYFLTASDIRKVRLQLSGIRSVQEIINYFDNRLFVRKNFATKREVLDQLYAVIQEANLGSQSFFESVENHELNNSSFFGNGIAIPHPEVATSSSTYVAVAQLVHPVNWNDHIVSTVFLVSIERHNPKAYKIWSILTFLISDDEVRNALKKAVTFDELIQRLLDYCN